MISNRKDKKGISLIVLVITIIVMVILAGAIIVSVNNTGILTETQSAKDKTIISQEKEQISLAMVNMKLENKKSLEERASYIEQYLETYTGAGNNKVYALETEYIIHFLKSNRVYITNETGKLEQADPIIIKEDTVAGAFEGTGTEQNPYIIMSIEDLVWLANRVNSGTNTYSGKWVALGKPLDFKAEWSYKNAKATYKYDETTNSYIPDENSETTLMELCTTGSGFVPINGYLGNFDGKDYTISNIYINRSGNCGLFALTGPVQNKYARIKNLIINGQVTSTNGYAAGFVGMPYGTIIENCVNDVDVTGFDAGGFVGYFRYGTGLIVRNCTNNGKIKASDSAGGIIGYAYSGAIIDDCVNNDEIIAGWCAGGMVRGSL